MSGLKFAVHHSSLLLTLCVFASHASGGVVIQITESGGDTTFEQSGTFDETGLSAVLGFGSNGFDFFRHTFASGGDFWVQTDNVPNFLGHQGLTFSASASWTNPSGSLISPTVLSTSGDFGFYVDPINMRAASSDTPGSITVDASLADLGFTLGETLTITNPNNNDTIVVTSAIPEPTSFSLVGLAVLVSGSRRRRRVQC